MTLQCGNIYIYRCTWIDDPHDKIALCICDQKSWFFWFNSDARFHGQGQLHVSVNEHPKALTKNCYLDLSSVKAASPRDLKAAKDCGQITLAFRTKVLAVLANPIPLLPDVQRNLALTNLAPPAGAAASTP